MDKVAQPMTPCSNAQRMIRAEGRIWSPGELAHCACALRLTHSANTMAQVERNGFHSGGWAEGERGGGPGAGKHRGPAGVVAIRTDGGEQGASYAGISPDSVGAGQDLANGMASPARRHPSGVLLALKT